MLVVVPPPKTRPDFVDYSHETRVSKNALVRFCVVVALGLVFYRFGVFWVTCCRGLPGTVFILVAVYFFARSSPRFYNFLLNNRVFGGLIRDWRAGLGLPLRAKVLAVTLIVLSIGSSLLFYRRFGCSAVARSLRRRRERVPPHPADQTPGGVAGWPAATSTASTGCSAAASSRRKKRTLLKTRFERASASFFLKVSRSPTRPCSTSAAAWAHWA